MACFLPHLPSKVKHNFHLLHNNAYRCGPQQLFHGSLLIRRVFLFGRFFACLFICGFRLGVFYLYCVFQSPGCLPPRSRLTPGAALASSAAEQALRLRQQMAASPSAARPALPAGSGSPQAAAAGALPAHSKTLHSGLLQARSGPNRRAKLALIPGWVLGFECGTAVTVSVFLISFCFKRTFCRN